MVKKVDNQFKAVKVKLGPGKTKEGTVEGPVPLPLASALRLSLLQQQGRKAEDSEEEGGGDPAEIYLTWDWEMGMRT